MEYSKQEAEQYLSTIAFERPAVIGHEAAPPVEGEFEEQRKQAQLVGSSLIAFESGVTPDIREAISNAALLAQLVADKEFSAEEKPFEWFDKFFEVLKNVGWTVQSQTWKSDRSAGTLAQVHENILSVATSILGPAAPALAIISASISALKAASDGSSWITIFKRDAQKSRLARFDVGLVSDDTKIGPIQVQSFAFVIEAESAFTQVLLFKSNVNRSRFESRSATITVNRRSIADLKDQIHALIAQFQSKYLGSIKNLS